MSATDHDAEAFEPSADFVRPQGLRAKLAAMVGEVQHIPKNGRNEFHKYNFASESDVSRASRKLQSRYGVFFCFSMLAGTFTHETFVTSKDKQSVRTTFTGVLRIFDADSPEVIESHFPAYSHDTDDKGANKALTAFRKYATLTTLQISTGDDPDNHAGGQDATRTQQENQQQKQRNAEEQKRREAENRKRREAEEQKKREAEERKKRDAAKTPAAPPPGMEGRSFAALPDELRGRVTAAYRTLAVRMDSPAAAHDTVLRGVWIDVGGRADTVPRWWDGFTPEQLDRFTHSAASAPPEKPAPEDASSDSVPSDPPANPDEERQQRDRIIGALIEATTDWGGEGRPSAQQQRDAMERAARLIGYDRQQRATRWADLTTDELESALGTAQYAAEAQANR